MVMEAYACAAGGVLTAISVPTNALAIAIANLAAGGLLATYIRKTKKVQKFYFDFADTVAVLAVAIVVGMIAFHRFTPQFLLNFETEDPSSHIKFIVDTLKLDTVIGEGEFMYVGQFTNALFAEFFMPFLESYQVYIPYIVKLVINFFFSGVMFYACISLFFDHKKIAPSLLAIGCTLVFLLGYPLNDLMFGFTYLQYTITIVSLIAFTAEYFAKGDLPQIWTTVTLSMLCLCVSLGYTLFAPAVYFALFFTITVLHLRTNKFQISWKWVWKYCGVQLKIFLFPTALTALFYFVLGNRNFDSVSALSLNGYVYRNLYSDFVLFLPLAIWAFITLTKRKENIFVWSVSVVLAVQTMFLLLFMVKGSVSSYYYFKINYFIWLVVLLLASIALLLLEKQYKMFVASLCTAFVFLAGMFYSQFDLKLWNAGIQTTPGPYSLTETWFRIYDTNRSFLSRTNAVPDDIFEMGKAVSIDSESRADPPQMTVFLGTSRNWFRAISGQRNFQKPELTKEAIMQAIDELNQSAYIFVETAYFTDESLLNECIQMLESKGKQLCQTPSGWVYIIL